MWFFIVLEIVFFVYVLVKLELHPFSTPDMKAQRLLKASITKSEWAFLKKHSYLVVASKACPEREYHIPRKGGMIVCFHDGVPLYEYCLQPLTLLPDDDLVLAHKLMLECSEEEFLEKANRFAPRMIRSMQD
jgi:hypothetical protein